LRKNERPGGGARPTETWSPRLPAPLPMETTREVICPYCGQIQTIFLDLSVPHQDYIEDCQVCCQPIEFRVTVEREGGISVEARRGDE
jgi:Cysteine-rich CPXCG